MCELTHLEQKVYEFLTDMYESAYSFRLVVVGKGAILETNVTLGRL